MDPKANLEQQLSAAREVIAAVQTPPWVSEGYQSSDEWGDEQDRSEYFEHVAEQGAGLAELVIALDEWRRKGGFDPYDRSIV